MFGHLLLICLCPMELYMTASRTSLLGFFVAVTVISLYCVPQLRISPQMKLRLRRMTLGGLIVLIICGVILEYRSNGMTKWLIKPGYSSVNAENDLNAFGDILDALDKTSIILKRLGDTVLIEKVEQKEGDGEE